jgi:hypothetical protein
MEKMGKRNTDNKMMMFMRNIRLSKSCIGKEEIDAVTDVLHREYLGMGQDVHKFEDDLKDFFGRDFRIRTYVILFFIKKLGNKRRR